MERLHHSKGGLLQSFRELRQGKEGFVSPCGKFVEPWIGYAREEEDYARVLRDYDKRRVYAIL